MPYKIEFELSKCIGAASCAAICPENWQIQDNGKAKVLKTEITEEELECNLNAAQSCPVNAIHIIDEKGKKLI